MQSNITIFGTAGIVSSIWIDCDCTKEEESLMRGDEGDYRVKLFDPISNISPCPVLLTCIDGTEMSLDRTKFLFVNQPEKPSFEFTNLS